MEEAEGAEVFFFNGKFETPLPFGMGDVLDSKGFEEGDFDGEELFWGEVHGGVVRFES